MENFAQRLNNWDELFSSEEFEKEYCYKGNDLGCTYSEKSTSFRVWAPTASELVLNLYAEGVGDNLITSVPMTKSLKGTWKVDIDGDWKDRFYTYSITFENVKRTSDPNDAFKVNLTYIKKGDTVTNEAVDIYARAVGVNGRRGMIVNLAETNPTEWNNDKSPEYLQYTDAVIYELHMRDLSTDDNSGILNKGKYLGVVEKGTKTKEGYSTGIDHIKELGATHVHFLPMQDFGSIDETGVDADVFNWGYDPMNYNIPEGSYATDAYNGKVRIREFKQMVKGMHESGIRIIMDVVFNHTYNTADSNFDKIVPNYYHRNVEGRYTNGSGCGNETASDRYMFRKLMIDSLKYWVNEYHVDGFRFDLMAVHDIDTMNIIKKELMKINPSILLYGEGWIGGETKFDSMKACFKVAASKLNDIAVFNDDIRDAIKGSIMNQNETGFATGGMFDDNAIYGDKELITNKVRFGMAGSIKHPQIKGELFSRRPEEYSGEDLVFWAKNPTQSINYESAHDNWTLWDKILMSNKNRPENIRISMNKLSAAMLFLAQGIPFIHAGEEILRSKPCDDEPGGYVDDSFNKSDEINQLKWNDKAKYIDVFEYYQGLIRFRKKHPALRLTTAAQVRKSLKFVEGLKEGIIAYSIKNMPEEEKAKEIFVVLNGLDTTEEIKLPKGMWSIYINADKAGTRILSKAEGSIKLSPISATVLVK